MKDNKVGNILRVDYTFQEKYDSGQIRKKSFKTETEVCINIKEEVLDSNSEYCVHDNDGISLDEDENPIRFDPRIGKSLPDIERNFV